MNDPGWHDEGAFLVPDWRKGGTWQGHIPFAAWLVGVKKPRVLVELGTFHGTSYFAFCQAAVRAKIDMRCYAVDTWQGDHHIGRYSDQVFDDVSAANAENYSGFSTLLRMTFDEALAKFDAGSIDVLHIDGLHTYAAVSHDFQSWLPKMKPNGVVLFHDTQVDKSNFGVLKYWSELSEKYITAEFKHSYGLGILLLDADQPDKLLKLVEAMRREAKRDKNGPRAFFEARATDIEEFMPIPRKRQDPIARLYRSVRKRVHRMRAMRSPG